MVSLSFITPAALALLLLLPALWALTLLTPRRLARWRFWASLLVRSAILAALVLALAGAQLVRPVRELTTVFLVDASDSVAPAQRERALRYVDEALRAMPPNDRAAVVVFGENALVERAPSDVTTLGRINSAPVTTRTNIQDAVQLGLALLPAETQKRLVLISDGGENVGRAAEAARLAAVRGVPLDVVILPSELGPDVILSALTAPSSAREGQEVALAVNVSATFATTGRLQVFVDGRPAGERAVAIPAGQSSYEVRLPSGEAGFRRLEVRLEAQGDVEPQNNRVAAFTEVQGPPRVLLIAADPARAQNLERALSAAGVRVETRAPAQAPASLEQLGGYAGVVLVDTPARALPRPLLETLPLYVKELGRGLAMTGGMDSFGAGGYRRTQIEEALPVSLDPRETIEQPDLALVMVIDRSGSMDEPGGSGRTKLDLAKEAVYQASLGLSQQDTIGLVVFDDTAQWVLEVQQLPPAVEIERALGTFGPGGGTDIRPGVERAAEALANVDAKVKHVILLTDGIAESNYSDLVAQMRAAGITISTFAVGNDANPNLRQVAEQGGGRFYQITRVEEVPEVFLQETVIAAGRDVVEGRFIPQVALPVAPVRGLGAVPPLFGYNGTEIKETARAILVTPDGKPILAQWQYGLGRAVAWTSDVQGKWAAEWVAWEQFPRFVSGLADLLLPPRTGGALALRGTVEGGQGVLEVTAQDERGRPLNDLTLAGRLVDPENNGGPLTFTQVGPGRYRAVAPATVPGVYLAQVAAADDQGRQLGVATTGLVVSYSLEYSERRDNPALLRDLARITGGRVDPLPAEVFAPPAQAVGSVREIGLPLLWLALVLWPLDIALRRLMLRLEDLAPGLAALRRRAFPHPSPAAAGPSLGRLSAAKQRAQARERRSGPEVPAAAFTPRAQPEAPRAQAEAPPARPEERPAPPEEGKAAAEEQFARLLAAKQRARKKRE
ncbi:MAG TPA: VWA domain-containing protein [Roseiflexaceae bacterium]|nr:VWA domain-containing protein [Roseiflexaceae bacterium]